MYVTDYANNAVRKINLLNGSYVSSPFTNISTPYGLAVDANENNIYVVSGNLRVIYKVPLTSKVVDDSMIIAGSRFSSAGNIFHILIS